MFSVRALSRAIPKSSFRTLSTRSVSIPRTSNLLRASWTTSSRPIGRTFTSSALRWEAAGQVDTELSAKIDHELSLEKEQQEFDELPAHLQDFIENSGFEIQDKVGSEEVVLLKNFGDETVKVSFSIADLNAQDLDAEDPMSMSEDPAMADDLEMGEATPQTPGARTKGTINAGRTPDGNFNVAPEDSIAPADRPELADDESGRADGGSDSPAFPVRVNVTVMKGNGGALQVETIAQDGVIDIDNVYYFPTAELADAQTADVDFQRSNVYAGPPFVNLDEELQMLFERYLDERGINAMLASFVPDYIYHKEQKEYLRWLDNVKAFVDA